MTQEYTQARKIALKDPRVRTAFDKANKVLEKRIIEIDPTLKPFIERQQAAGRPASGDRGQGEPHDLDVEPGHGIRHLALHPELQTALRANPKMIVEASEAMPQRAGAIQDT